MAKRNPGKSLPPVPRPDYTYVPELREDVLQEGFVRGYRPGEVAEGIRISGEDVPDLAPSLDKVPLESLTYTPPPAPPRSKRQVRRQSQFKPQPFVDDPSKRGGLLGSSRFQFETPEQIQQRIQASRFRGGGPRFREIEEQRAIRLGRGVARPSTSDETRQFERLQEEQSRLDKMGQVPFALRQGAGEFINSMSALGEGTARFVDDYIRDHGAYDIEVFRQIADSLLSERQEWDRLQSGLDYGDRRSIASRVIPTGVSIGSQIAILKKFPFLGQNPAAVMGVQKMLTARANGMMDAKTLAMEGLTGAAQGYAMGKASRLADPFARVAAGAAGSAAPPAAGRAILSKPQDFGQTAEEALLGGLFALPGGGPTAVQRRQPRALLGEGAPTVTEGAPSTVPPRGPAGAPPEGLPSQLRPASPELLARQRGALEPTPTERALGSPLYPSGPPIQFPLTDLVKSRMRSTNEVLGANADPVTGLPMVNPRLTATDTSYEAWLASQQMTPGQRPRIADDPYLQEIQGLQQSALAKMGMEGAPEQALEIANLYRESIERPVPYKAKAYQQAWDAMAQLTPQEMGAMGEFGLQMRDPQFPSRLQEKFEGPGVRDFQISPGTPMESPQGPLDIQIYRAKGQTLNVAGTQVERPGSLSREYGATHYPYATDLRLPGPASNTDEIAISMVSDQPLYENMLQIGRVPNPLMELRIQDREMIGGGKGTFLIEAQSSWAQDKNKKQTNPIRNQWTTRALEFMVQEAMTRGTDGILIPTTPEQIYTIQKYGPVKQDAEGNYINSDGTNVSPIIKRYQKEFPELINKVARKMGVKPETREVLLDEDTGETTSLLFLPLPAVRNKSLMTDLFKSMFGVTGERPKAENYSIDIPDSPTQSPVFYVPDKIFDALAGAGTNGYRVDLTEAMRDAKYRVPRKVTDAEAVAEFERQTLAMITAAMDRGLKSIAVSRASGSPERKLGTERHETVHVAQGQLLPPGETRFEKVHDYQWAQTHPILQKAAATRMGQLIADSLPGTTEPLQGLAYELPAYINQGMEGDLATMLDLTSGERIDYMLDYIDHLTDKWGPSALDIIEEVANLRPGLKELTSIMKGGAYAGGRIGGAFESGGYPARGAGPTWSEGRRFSGPLTDDAPDLAPQIGAGTGMGTGMGGQAPGAVATASPRDVRPGGGYGRGSLQTDLLEGPMDMVPVPRPDPSMVTPRARLNEGFESTRIVPMEGGGFKAVDPDGMTYETQKDGWAVGATRQEVQDKLDSDRDYFESLYSQMDQPQAFASQPSEAELARRDQESLDAIRQLSIDPIYTDQVNNTYNKEVAQAFIKLLQDQGITYDPKVRPFLQVTKALMEGKLQPERLDLALKENNMSWEEFAEAYQGTASDAGRTLGYLSWIEGRWSKLEKENPGLARKLKPALGRAKSVMRDIDNTILGRNIVQRGGSLMQKMMLSQMSTFATNTITTMMQIPAFATYQSAAAWWKTFVEAEPGTGSFGDHIMDANEAAMDAMMASFEVIKALNPKQIKEMVAGFGFHPRPGKMVPFGVHIGRGTEYLEYQSIVKELETAFPELHRKMQALSGGQETLAEGKESLDILKGILAEKNKKGQPAISDPAERAKLLDKVAKYESRLKSDIKGIGRLMGAGDWLYDQALRPMAWSEYMFRRPMFVGQLRLELQREGINLDSVMASGSFGDLPYEAVHTAVNRALEFTYAYEPSKDGPGFERAGALMINFLNSLGPANYALGTNFPRALYNGMKFAYEWGPLGGLAPANKIFRHKFVIDPATGEPHRVNKPEQKDWDRLMKALIGTLGLAMAWGLGEAIGGDEWWQIKSGRTTKDGRPIYIDIRKYKPFSEFVRIGDLIDRLYKGTIGDVDVGKQLVESITGYRSVEGQPEAMDYIQAVSDWYSGEPSEPMGMKAAEGVGKFGSLFLTPLLNVRDLHAQFSDAENVKRETRGQGFSGPFIDKLPWMRQGLPPLTSPTEPGPIGISDQPGIAQFGGLKMVAGENFAGREWRRLGLANKTFLPRDPDPTINRFQNQLFEQVISKLGDQFSKNPKYIQANDSRKAAMWEAIVGGDKGIRALVKEYAEAANPREKAAREAQGKMPGPLQRKDAGLDEVLKKIRGGQ